MKKCFRHLMHLFENKLFVIVVFCIITIGTLPIISGYLFALSRVICVVYAMILLILSLLLGFFLLVLSQPRLRIKLEELLGE